MLSKAVKFKLLKKVEPDIEYLPGIFGDFADEITRAIEDECAKVPESELYLLLKCVETNLSKGMSKSMQRLQAKMLREALAAAPQPVLKATPLDLMECLTDRPIKSSGAVKDKCVAAPKAEQPEPFAWYDPRDGTFTTFKDTAEHWQQKYGLKLVPLYAAPPDLVAENARLQTLVDQLQWENKGVAEWRDIAVERQRRIAELEAENENYAKDILRLLDTIKYLRGIAERGAGNTCPEDMTVEQFVLTYVKGLEQRIAELEAHPNGMLPADTNYWMQRSAEQVNRIAELTSALERARERFDKLARLGNEPHYGNSFGNQIALEGIAPINEVLK